MFFKPDFIPTAGAANLTVRSVITTDSPTNADGVLLCSSSSFTITLFTAVGNTGKQIYVQHNGTTGQIYTINTTSSQTVGPMASGQFKLYSAGEWALFYSDGANWQISGHPPKVTYLSETLASGTNGGTFTSGSYATRVLNTQAGDTTFCSISSNQFTLVPGTYRISATCPSSNVALARARLQNISDTATTLQGQNTHTGTSGSSFTVAQFCLVQGTFTITASKTYEIQHRCSSTLATTGWGSACSFSDSEIYTNVIIEKLI